MKLSLVVTQGKAEGKVIPIPVSQFVIGRDPECHLRPASPMISKRHCILVVKGDKCLVRDLKSTNGTFVNDKQVQGEVEIKNEDRLKVGPLVFLVRCEVLTPVDKPTPIPPPKVQSLEEGEDDSIAAMLMDIQEGEGGAAPEESSTHTTVTEMPIESMQDPALGGPGLANKKTEVNKPAPSTQSSSNAAKAILDRYTKRRR